MVQRSTSPRPSPPRRGRIVRRLLENSRDWICRTVFRQPETVRRVVLSWGERKQVRAGVQTKFIPANVHPKMILPPSPPSHLRVKHKGGLCAGGRLAGDEDINTVARQRLHSDEMLNKNAATSHPHDALSMFIYWRQIALFNGHALSPERARPRAQQRCQPGRHRIIQDPSPSVPCCGRGRPRSDFSILSSRHGDHLRVAPGTCPGKIAGDEDINTVARQRNKADEMTFHIAATSHPHDVLSIC